MKLYQKMMLAIAAILFTSTLVSAQSTVYVILSEVTNTECQISINGEPCFEMCGSIKKIYDSIPPYTVSDTVVKHPCVTKCTINEEGKVLFAADLDFTNVGNGDVYKYAAETQLNLVDGATYYIKILPKISNDFVIEVITQKEAEKIFKKKGVKFLPEYTL
ncbi:MAG: hypothetical protein IJX40_02155 [Alistipes sp.]|nr:hypothetical protein [Alistipes sp.]